MAEEDVPYVALILLLAGCGAYMRTVLQKGRGCRAPISPSLHGM